ncbi:unnamed protein product [Parajaminaea phylloscopi]
MHRFGRLWTLVTACTIIASPIYAVQVRFDDAHRGSTLTSRNLYPKPADDPFYIVPENVSAYKPGEVIRSRSIPITRFGLEADRAFHILYRTNGQDAADATVATIVAPRFPAPGPPKIVAVIPPENSAHINCAPSFTYLPLTKSPNNFEVLGLMGPQTAIHQGWYALVPDFEGSKSAWLVGYVEGQAILDAMRAIQNHGESLPDSRGARFAISGYSGGAHGGAWAAQLASTYAPELNIVGFVLGGLPADIRNVSYWLDARPTATLLYLAAAGLGNGYKDVKDLFTSRVKPGNASALWRQVQDGSSCANIAYQNGAFRMDSGFTEDYKGRPISQSPILLHRYDREKLGKYELPITKIPGYVIHTSTDEIIPLPQAQEYVQCQCKQGAQIEFALLHDGVHIEVGFRAQPHFVRKMKEFFEAAEGQRTIAKGCSTSDVQAPFPSFDDINDLLLGRAAVSTAQRAQRIGFASK